MSRVVPLTLAVALFMENMDATVIATSLPAIAADIGTTPVALKLAFTAYFVAVAIFIPISAWMADKFGAREVFRAAILVFVLGSLGCALAHSLEAFVLARFVEGMGASMMSPLARLILFRVTPRRELVNAMAWLTVPGVMAPMVGPPLGGFLTTYASWHWIFIINVPVGIAGFFLVGRLLPPIEPGPPRRMDFPGFLLLAVAFSGTLFGLSLVSVPGLSVWVALGCTLAGLLACGLYLVHALRSEHPLIDPRLFRIPTFRAAISGTALFLVGAGAIPFLLPLMLQLGFGMTPFESGLVVLAGGAGALFSKFFMRRLYAFLGFKTALISMALLAAFGLGLHGMFDPQTPIVVILAILLVTGTVRSCYFTGQNALVFSDVSTREAGPASAISAIARPIATALAVALAGMTLQVSSSLREAPLELVDFQLAFFLIAVISALGVLPFLRLPGDAGAEVSGHAPKRKAIKPGDDGQ